MFRLLLISLLLLLFVFLFLLPNLRHLRFKHSQSIVEYILELMPLFTILIIDVGNLNPQSEDNLLREILACNDIVSGLPYSALGRHSNYLVAHLNVIFAAVALILPQILLPALCVNPEVYLVVEGFVFSIHRVTLRHRVSLGVHCSFALCFGLLTQHDRLSLISPFFGVTLLPL